MDAGAPCRVRIYHQKIKKYCKNKDLKLKELLHKANVSPTAYYSLVGKDSALPRSIHALANALTVPAKALLEDTHSPPLRTIKQLQKEEKIFDEHKNLKSLVIVVKTLALQGYLPRVCIAFIKFDDFSNEEDILFIDDVGRELQHGAVGMV